MRVALIGIAMLALAAAGAFLFAPKGGADFLLSTLGFTPEIAAAGPETIGDWRIDCRGTDTARECVASQRIIDGDRNAQLLQLEISIDPEGKHEFTAVMPLGVWLEPGIAVQVGEGNAKNRMTFSFERCVAAGCIATGHLAAEHLDALHGQDQGVLFVADKKREIIGIPFSLNGFEEASAALRGGKSTTVTRTLQSLARSVLSALGWAKSLIEGAENADER